MPHGLRMRSILVVAAFLAAMLAVGLDASAKPKKTTVMQVPKGATVEVQSKSQMRMNNSNGETGTFSCECVGNNTSGSCILGRGSSSIICGAGDSTCTGTCKLYTSTGGLTGGGVMMMKKN